MKNQTVNIDTQRGNEEALHAQATTTLAAAAAVAVKEVAAAAAEAVATVAAQAAAQNASLGKDIAYIKESIVDIKQTIKDAANNYITKDQFNVNDKMTADHEARIRATEKSIQYWAGILGLLGIASPLLWKILFKV